MIRKILMPLMATGLLTLAACNTVQGVGQDIESAGQCGEDVLEGQDC
ncbi:entericidin A/B family lipoprotein [Sphingomicrobium nitratireducens]|nr:entericidin A/B family lipoprotein [Sphingomicrobium nitratireducens]